MLQTLFFKVSNLKSFIRYCVFTGHKIQDNVLTPLRKQTFSWTVTDVELLGCSISTCTLWVRQVQLHVPLNASNTIIWFCVILIGRFLVGKNCTTTVSNYLLCSKLMQKISLSGSKFYICYIWPNYLSKPRSQNCFFAKYNPIFLSIEILSIICHIQFDKLILKHLLRVLILAKKDIKKLNWLCLIFPLFRSHET